MPTVGDVIDSVASVVNAGKSWFSPSQSKPTVEVAPSSKERLQSIHDEIAQQLISGYRARQDFSGEKFSGGMNYVSAFGSGISAMRERSIRAYWESMQARGIINRLVDTVINTGLSLESTPVSSMLGLSQEERKEISNKIETRFNLWGSSKDCDLSKENTLGQIERILYRNQLVKGDYFAALPFSDNPGLTNPLQIKIIKPELVSTPFDATIINEIRAKGNYVVDGVEFSENDEEVAIHVRVRQPINKSGYFVSYNTQNDMYGNAGLPGTFKWVRFPKYGPVSGRVVLIHGKVQEFGNEPRGIPALAHVAHELEKITDYSLLELMAAVANATIALVVEPGENAPATNPFPGNSFVPPSLVQTAESLTAASATLSDSGYTNLGKTVLQNTGGLLVSSLKANEKLSSHDTKRPNVNFGEFVDSITKPLSASLSMPREVLDMIFGNNFSASRGALKLYWQSLYVKRDDFISDFKTPVFNSWLLGEVGTGKLILKGFEDLQLRAAWQSAKWIGIPSPSIDPGKEEKAAKMRVEEGFSTREQEAQKRHGSSFDSNVDRLTSENKRLAEANKPLAEQNNNQNDQRAAA